MTIRHRTHPQYVQTSFEEELRAVRNSIKANPRIPSRAEGTAVRGIASVKPDSMIAAENLKTALRLCKLVEGGHAGLEVFLIGSTAVGLGERNPHIEWTVESSRGSFSMDLKLLTNVRDDIDLVVVCDSLERDLSSIRLAPDEARNVEQSGEATDVTANIVARDDLTADLKSEGSPALRRAFALDQACCLSARTSDNWRRVAVQAWSAFDDMHDVDFRTMMQTARLLTTMGLDKVTLGPDQLERLFPSFLTAATSSMHLGFPLRRTKLTLKVRP